MSSCAVLVAVLVVLWVAGGATAAPAAPRPSEAPSAGPPRPILSTLRRGHPRLFLTDEVLARLRDGRRAGGDMERLYIRLLASASRIMNETPVEHQLEGPRLLSVSRRCLQRVSTLALAARLSEERKYADRAWREMEAAAGFRDWNPSHFLDTAEMTAALGIGYDWLYDDLSVSQRERVRQAILEKGLTPGLECYRGKARYGWWVRARHNWNQVCNGGLAIGALAVAEEEPEAAGEVLEAGLKSVPAAMASFGADGGWAEGPGYWGYTMMYTSRYLDALQTALGSMQGLDRTAGLAEAGMFRLHTTGPTGATFNFADAREAAGSASAMFWLARTFGRPVYAWFERSRPDDDPFHLVWYTAEAKPPDAAGLGPNMHFRGVGVVVFRERWEDPKAVWVAFKGGDNKANHSHLDLGTFVLEADGQRWAVDLGPDNYNLPGYFGGQRWNYYRLRTEGHNTLLLNGRNQDAGAAAAIVAFDARAGAAVADLSAGYPMARSVERGIRMRGGRRVLVQDEVETDAPVDLVWAVHTRAAVELDGPRAVLKATGQALSAQVLEPRGAVFEVAAAKGTAAGEAQQPGVRKLIVRLAAGAGATRLAVEFAPGEKPAAPTRPGPKAPALEPLARWPGRLR
jgi:hypothetical protein